MRLNLRGVMEKPGTFIEFSESLDMTGLEFPFGRPFVSPIMVEGRVENKAGSVLLSAAAEAELTLLCDRCASIFVKPFRVHAETLLCEDPEEATDAVPIVGHTVDTQEAILPFIVLAIEQKHLCREDCKGLCPYCGCDLNKQTCDCIP